MPETWDWRTSSTANRVSPIKQQGTCGSCWSFSTIATYESLFAINNAAGQFTETDFGPWPWASEVTADGFLTFSEQQLVDCDVQPMYCYGGNNSIYYTVTASQGCNGGLECTAFAYLIGNNLTLDSVYPYTGVQETCKYDKAKGTGIAISTFWYIFQNTVADTK